MTVPERRAPILSPRVRARKREPVRYRALSMSCANGWQRLLVAACIGAALAAGAVCGRASARQPPARAHTVYVCAKVSQIWRTPGHHPVGIVVRRDRFTITRYSPSRRWAFGVRHRPGHTRGWVRRSALCRHKPAPTPDT
jgi:hypothetical protein